MSFFRTRYGVWVDDAASMVATPEYMDRAKAIGYEQLRLMVDSSASLWDKRYTLNQLAKINILAIYERDLPVGLTFWPIPHKPTIDIMVADLDTMLEYVGATTVSAEAEGLMTAAMAKEFGWDILSAKMYLHEKLTEMLAKHDVTFEMTTHPSHPEAQAPDLKSPSKGFLASRTKRQLWQIYPTRHDWKRRVVNWHDRYGPFGRAKDAERLAKLSLQYGHRPCFGTPVWDLKWPDHTIEEVMHLNHETLMLHEPDLIVDWMSGNTIGRFRDVGYNPQIIEIRKQIILQTRVPGIL